MNDDEFVYLDLIWRCVTDDYRTQDANSSSYLVLPILKSQRFLKKIVLLETTEMKNSVLCKLQ